MRTTDASERSELLATTVESSPSASTFTSGVSGRASKRNTKIMVFAIGCGAVVGATVAAVRETTTRARSDRSGSSPPRLGSDADADADGGLGLLVGGATFPQTYKLAPSGPAGDEEYKTTEDNWALYHERGDEDVKRATMYDFTHWPTAELEEAVMWVKGTSPEAYQAFDAIQTFPEDYKLHAMRISQGLENVGPAFSHLSVWLKAKKHEARAAIIAAPDAYINAHCGPPTEFDSFLLSFLLRGPSQWDVLFLDRGERGVDARQLAAPEALFRNKAWDKSYILYKNVAKIIGERLETEFYMVSKRFLDGLTSNLRQDALVDVNAWLNRGCETGRLMCYSYTAENWYEGATSGRKAVMPKPSAYAPITDDYMIRHKQQHSTAHSDTDGDADTTGETPSGDAPATTTRATTTESSSTSLQASSDKPTPATPSAADSDALDAGDNATLVNITAAPPTPNPPLVAPPDAAAIAALGALPRGSALRAAARVAESTTVTFGAETGRYI
jgi:hypothetical protein